MNRWQSKTNMTQMPQKQVLSLKNPKLEFQTNFCTWVINPVWTSRTSRLLVWPPNLQYVPKTLVNKHFYQFINDWFGGYRFYSYREGQILHFGQCVGGGGGCSKTHAVINNPFSHKACVSYRSLLLANKAMIWMWNWSCAGQDKSKSPTFRDVLNNSVPLATSGWVYLRNGNVYYYMALY